MGFFLIKRSLLIFLWCIAFLFGIWYSNANAEISNHFFLTSDGVRLHYLEAGEGRTLVFIPGWTMPAEIWEPQLLYFSKNFHVVALDPRSQGESEIAKSGHEPKRRAQDIKELIDTLKVDSVIMVGWSLGVLETLTYIKFFGQDQVDAIVLVDNSIGEDPPPVSDPTFLSRLKKERLKTVDRFVRGMYKTPQSEDYYQRIISQALKTPLDISIALLRPPYSRGFWKEIVYETEKSVLYVVSPRFKEQAQNLKKRKPEVSIAIFEQAGHALFVDEADRFNQLLEDFISGKAVN